MTQTAQTGEPGDDLAQKLERGKESAPSEVCCGWLRTMRPSGVVVSVVATTDSK